uniref:hypothetical protein n=1 Tax=Candidatus Enterovibrio escicola TaxID=1927127 RepID=UPI0011BA9B41|nr:hypothetical protein [Candidatus Enterovibrio escacola]
MQGGKFGRRHQHRRQQRVTYSYPSPYAVNSFFRTIRSRRGYLVHFLCAVHVNYNAQISEALANMNAINKVIKLGMPVRHQTN